MKCIKIFYIHNLKLIIYIIMTKEITFIAEIGINHNGDVSLAKKMMRLAKIVDAIMLNFKKEHLK